MNDYYEVLGVATDASRDEIIAAYREKAQNMHPDKAGGSVERFQELSEAYKTLKDDEKRAAYDRGDKPAGLQTPVDVARQRIAQLFKAAIDAARDNQDMIKTMRDSVTEGSSKMVRDIDAASDKIIRLGDIRERVTYKGDTVNLFANVIDMEIRQEQARINHLTQEIEIVKAAMEILNDYECKVEQAAVEESALFQGGLAGGIGTGSGWR